MQAFSTAEGGCATRHNMTDGALGPLYGMMNIANLRCYLDDPDAAATWLRGLGIVDARRAYTNLLDMAEAGVPMDLLAEIAAQLEKHLPGCADPDLALHNLERFVRAARNPLAVGTLFERIRGPCRPCCQSSPQANI